MSPRKLSTLLSKKKKKTLDSLSRSSPAAPLSTGRRAPPSTTGRLASLHRLRGLLSQLCRAGLTVTCKVCLKNKCYSVSFLFIVKGSFRTEGRASSFGIFCSIAISSVRYCFILSASIHFLHCQWL